MHCASAELSFKAIWRPYDNTDHNTHGSRLRDAGEWNPSGGTLPLGSAQISDDIVRLSPLKTKQSYKESMAVHDLNSQYERRLRAALPEELRENLTEWGARQGK